MTQEQMERFYWWKSYVDEGIVLDLDVLNQLYYYQKALPVNEWHPPHY